MRILFLAHRIPYPPNKGDKIRSFHLLSHLASRHELHLATLIDDPTDLSHLSVLEKQVASLGYARIDQPLRKLWSLKQVASSASITVRYFYSRSLQHHIDRLLATTRIDALICSSSPTAEYVFRSEHRGTALARVPKIMDLIDVDSQKWRQYAEQSIPVLARLYRCEADRLADYERRIQREFDRLLLVSEKEKRWFPAPDPDGKLRAVTNGVDFEYFHPSAVHEQPAEGPLLVFTGMMNYWPNVDGVGWFIDEVLPRVREAVPDVRLCVVGGAPVRRVRGWARREGVVVTGYVDDVRTYVARADACVVPLRIARGIQNKLLEAMAMGKPVVCTPEAFEGIEATPGNDLLVAGSAERFAAATVSLLTNPDMGRRIGDNARRCVELRYSWKNSLEAVDDMLAHVSRLDQNGRARAST